MTDEEKIRKALLAAQEVLLKYVEPGPRNAEETCNKLLEILDDKELNLAVVREEIAGH
jgi:hypothetical protein